MTAPPIAPGPGAGGVGGLLRELQAAAAVKRAARRRIAGAAAHPGADTLELGECRAAHAVAAARWVSLVRAAAHDGHPIAVIARAAGVTPASVYYRLGTGSASS